MYQQGSFQGNSFGSGSGMNTNRYQPSGFVQSHYQGQLTRNAASGPVTAHAGYQAGSSQGYSGMNTAMTGSGMTGFQQQSFTGGAMTPQNPVYRATNARMQEGPVIQHTGYTNSMNQGYQQGTSFSQAQQQFGGASSFGQGGVVGAMTPERPVYRATNARGQDGPVIQHTGYTSGMNQGFGTQSFNTPSFTNQSFGPTSLAGGFQQSSGFTGGAMTQQNPVYRATNAHEQDGPVIQHLGYSSGANQGFGAGMNVNNQNRSGF